MGRPVITGGIDGGRFVEMATIEDAAKLALALPDVIEDDATEIGRGRSPARRSPGNGRTPRPTSSGSVMRRRRASRSSPFASTT
jgi:hypothetical protein